MIFSDISPIISSIFITSQQQPTSSPDFIPLYVAIIAAVGTIVSKTPELLNTFFTNRKSVIHKFNIDDISFLKIKQISREKIDDKHWKRMKREGIQLLFLDLILIILLLLGIIFCVVISISPPNINNPIFGNFFSKLIIDTILFILTIYVINFLYKAITSDIQILPLMNVNAEEAKFVFFNKAILIFESSLDELIINILTIIKYMNLKLIEIKMSEQNPKEVKIITTTRLVSRSYELIINVREEDKECLIQLYFSQSTNAALVEGSYVLNRFINLAILDFKKAKKTEK